MTSTESISNKLKILSKIEDILLGSKTTDFTTDSLVYQDSIFNNPCFLFNIDDDIEFVIYFRTDSRRTSIYTPLSRISITNDISNSDKPFCDLYRTYKDCDNSYIKLSIDTNLYSILNWMRVDLLIHILKRIKESING